MRADLEDRDRIHRSRAREALFTPCSRQIRPRPAILAIHAGAGGTDSQMGGDARSACISLGRRPRLPVRNPYSTKVKKPGSKRNISVLGNTLRLLRSERSPSSVRFLLMTPRIAGTHPSPWWKYFHKWRWMKPNLIELRYQKDVFVRPAPVDRTCRKMPLRAHHTHPHGIVVTCQNERAHRAQPRSSPCASARPFVGTETGREGRGTGGPARGVSKAEWGSQIRRKSCILSNGEGSSHRHESGKHASVLDGGLDEFSESYLRQNNMELHAKSYLRSSYSRKSFALCCV